MEIVSELKSAFGDIIRNSGWMDDETKVKILDRFVETLHFKLVGDIFCNTLTLFVISHFNTWVSRQTRSMIAPEFEYSFGQRFNPIVAQSQIREISQISIFFLSSFVGLDCFKYKRIQLIFTPYYYSTGQLCDPNTRHFPNFDTLPYRPRPSTSCPRWAPWSSSPRTAR